jgi:hypothetical protein
MAAFALAAFLGGRLGERSAYLGVRREFDAGQENAAGRP